MNGVQLFSIPTTNENDEIINVDFTRFITVPSYKVLDNDEGEEWEDGNKRKHTEVVRTRVEGTFTMLFTDIRDFHNFFNLIEEKKIKTGDNSASVLCNVYVNNKDIIKTVYVKIKAEPSNTLPLFGTASYEGFPVTIEEV